MEYYETAARRGEAEVTEKKSRFIAQTASVETEGSAMEFLTEVRKLHRDARHNVYAFVLGPGGDILRQSDDGEPSGTAGAPTLNAIKSHGLTNTIVVVTRYFGGTLLGTGGLTRAYGLAAKEALLDAGAVRRELYDMYDVRITYPLLGKFQHEYNKHDYRIDNASYAGDITLRVRVKSPETPRFLRLTADLSGGAAQTVFLVREYL